MTRKLVPTPQFSLVVVVRYSSNIAGHNYSNILIGLYINNYIVVYISEI